ncbi:MAG TPA: aldose 1-epimerase, partial [Caulobacter sp.]|nr:aldose 1-epimerase [Caulobacter sp.]
DFGGAWPGRFDIEVCAALTPSAFQLTVAVRNTGEAAAPLGIGWHPYLAIPSGRRAQARLQLPAAARALVDNYDQVLPTGAVVPVAATPYDFSAGAALGSLYLDDCFTQLAASGQASARLIDPASGYALAVSAAAPPVTALQIYAPPDQAFVVIEPQYNLADPFAPVWTHRDTGMVRLEPGQGSRYDVSVALRPDLA